MNSTEPKFDAARAARYYVFIVPLLMSGTFLALLGNVYLLLCIRWIRKQAMTANLLLSLSLASADAWAALLLLNGWTVNNVIPHMFNVIFGEWIRCYYLVMELLRLSGMITSAIHLLVLALNHFFSIVSPLKYQTTVTPAFSYVSICFLWISPIFSTFILASIHDGEGFRTSSCHLGFYFRFSFRIAIFVQFAVPLVVMLLLYSYILIRLSAARRRCALMQQSQRKQSKEGDALLGTRLNRLSSRNDLRVRKQSVDNGYMRKQSTESRGSIITFSFNRMSAVKSKIKAVTTTLLILGTFAVGWLPAVFVFVLLCYDCLYTPNDSIQIRMFVINILVNTMIVSKLVLNPFIYAYRLTEIRYALWVMHATRFGRRPLDITRMPVKFKRMTPSVSANTQQRPSRVLIGKIPDIKMDNENNQENSNRKICWQCVQNVRETRTDIGHLTLGKKLFETHLIGNDHYKRSNSWHSLATRQRYLNID